jgi:hypothetical protein
MAAILTGKKRKANWAHDIAYDIERSALFKRVCHRLEIESPNMPNSSNSQTEIPRASVLPSNIKDASANPSPTRAVKNASNDPSIYNGSSRTLSTLPAEILSNIFQFHVAGSGHVAVNKDRLVCSK